MTIGSIGGRNRASAAQLRRRGLLVPSAVLLAAVVLVAAGAAGASGASARPAHGEPHTIAVTREPVTELAADGRRLVWVFKHSGESRRVYQFFDPARRRVASQLRVGLPGCGADF